MSTAAPSRTRPARDPGRVYPPPPVTAWGHVLRWGLTGLMALGLVGTLVLAATVPAEDAPMIWGRVWFKVLDLALGVLAGFLITQRRRRPVAVVAALSGLAVVSGFAACFLPWAIVSLSTRRRWREVLPMWLLVVVATIGASFTPWGRADVSVEGEPQTRVATFVIVLVFTVLWTGAFVALGFYVGARRDLVATLTERAETAEREQQLMVEAGQANERARIAREMHDVLAHRISLVSMHAGVLAYRDDLTPEKTREIAGIIQENAHASLTELRQVLSTLREPGGAADIAKPQPTLADLPALVAEAEATGARVVLSQQVVDPGQLPAPVSRHAYRMVQEALTNARKHAVGEPVTITLWGRVGLGLGLEVRNPLGAGSAVPGSGVGLVGLAERARLLGGTFAARREQGDFVVTAWLPWQS